MELAVYPTRTLVAAIAADREREAVAARSTRTIGRRRQRARRRLRRLILGAPATVMAKERWGT
jgi:hypothetical protein